MNQQFVPFFLQSSILWYGCSIVYAFTPWRASGLCPVFDCSEWSFHVEWSFRKHTYTGFCVNMSSLLRDQCPGVQLLACMALARLVLKTWSNCLQSSWTVFHSHQPWMRGPVSLYSSQRLMWSVCFVLAILIGVESHLIVFLTCTSLMGNDFEYLSRALWPSVCPLWWNVCSFVHLLTWLFAFLLLMSGSFYTLGPKPLPGLWFERISSRCLVCLACCQQGVLPMGSF